jgi:hypothetical protein
MAKSVEIAPSVNTTNVNTLNKRSIANLVGIVFHADLYKGRCKLYPVHNTEAANRLQLMSRQPEDWCRPDLMKCCDKHPEAHCYFTSEIKQDPDKANRWVCFVEDPYVPPGKYMLEVHRKKGKPIYQLIQLKGKMFARNPESGRPLDQSHESPVELMTDFVLGDGFSLEEALYNLCSYRYEKSIGVLREKDMDKVAKGENPESGFKTALGIAHTTQEMVAHAIGIVKLDFSFYKNLKKAEQFLAGDKGRFTKQIMFLWQKSGLESSILNFTKDSEQPNVDGLLVWTKSGDKLKRLSGLGIIEENYLEAYRKSVEEYKIGGKVKVESLSETIEIIGTGFALIDNVIETWKMIAAFDESWVAWCRMQEELSNVSRHVLAVPTEGQPWQAHGGGWFNRGDLMVLENLKMVADNAAADAQDAGWSWFMKVLPQALGFCEFGELFKDSKAFQKGQKIYSIAKIAGTKVDQLMHSNVIDIYEKQIATKWHDLNAWIANDNALMIHAAGMDQRHWSQQRIGLQFFVRAKVIYGLKRLIDLCGPLGGTAGRTSKYNFIESWTTPRKTFDEAVDTLNVEGYIRDLCLSDGFWVRKDHFLVDWLHHWHQEVDSRKPSKSADHRNEIIRTTEPENQDAWFKAEFQRYWPIHHMDIETVRAFAARFSTNCSAVDDSDVETCFLEYGFATWHEAPGDLKGQTKYLKISHWSLLRDGSRIDSETPVRAVLVFKKNSRASLGVPVTFQIERTDWLNVPGPVYRTVVRPLETSAAVTEGKIEKDSSLTHKYKDHLGAIVSFSYSYIWKKDRESEDEPAKVYYGLKPMIESTEWRETLKEFGFKKLWALARNAKQWIHPSTMDFAVKYCVGDGEAEGYAKTDGGFWNGTTEVTVQPELISGPPDPEFNARNRAKFADLEFLQRQLPNAPPPKPVYPNIEKVVLQYFREGSWKPVTGSGIDAEDPVRIVFVFKEKALRVPVIAQIKRTDTTVNFLGPHYSANVVSQLDHLGNEFKGKWGIVITPEYYLMQWIKSESEEMEVRVLNDGKMFRGIKPITNERVCSIGSQATAELWQGFKFSIYYGVGTDDPHEANEVVSIPGSLLNDVPLAVGDSIGGLSLSGYGVFGISYFDEVLYHGHMIACSTIPFIASVVDPDETPKPVVSGNDVWVFLQTVEKQPNLYDIVNSGTSRW